MHPLERSLEIDRQLRESALKICVDLGVPPKEIEHHIEFISDQIEAAFQKLAEGYSQKQG